MNTTNLARLRTPGAVLALIVVVILTGLFASRDTVYAQSFSPSSSVGLADPSAGAASDITSTFSIALPDYQFGGVINFTPPDWGFVARDADVQDGAIVSVLDSQATLGLLGDGCRTSVPVHFDMMESTTNTSTTVPFNDPEFEAKPVEDTEDKQGNEPDDQFDIGPDGLPLGVSRYPDYLTRIFKDPAGKTITPIFRSFGIGVPPPGGIEVSLNFVVFEPGVVFETPAGDTITTDPRLGFPSATVLQAVGDPDTKAKTGDSNSVSDFCTPLSSETTVFTKSKDNPDTASDESGYTLRTNPSAGTYYFTVYTLSQRDADGDGIENGMDPCPTVANPTWNPRSNPSPSSSDPYPDDDDRDGLPDEPGCDPDPSQPGRSISGVWDQDEDQYGNRGDNCPLVANSKGQPGGSGPDNQEDTDSDGIGDQCDSNPNSPDGQRFELCLVSPIDVGGGGTPPSPAPENMQPCDPNAALPAADAGDTTTTDGDTTGGDTTDGATTTTDGGTSTTTSNGAAGGAATGVGSLAPMASSIPAWATIVSALGGAGLLGSLGALAARIFGIRLPGRRD